MKFLSTFFCLLGSHPKRDVACRRVSSPLAVLMTAFVAALPVQAEMGAALAGNTVPAGKSSTLQIRLADDSTSVLQASSSTKGYSILVTDASGLPVSDVAVAIRLPEEGATGFFTDGAHSAVAYTNVSGVAKFAQVNWGATPGNVSIRVTAVKGDLHAGVLIEQTLASQLASGKTEQPAAVATPVQEATVSSPKKVPMPGTPVSVASVHSGATTDKDSTEAAAAEEPAVSIVNTAGSKGGSHGSAKKWIIIAAVAAGAGVGAALALSGKGSGAAAAAPGVSIGGPTISVGH